MSTKEQMKREEVKNQETLDALNVELNGHRGKIDAEYRKLVIDEIKRYGGKVVERAVSKKDAKK